MKAIALGLLLLTSGALQASEDYPSRAIFAGGCFWCMEPPYEKLDGIGPVISGYIGGDVDNPSYEQVASGGTGHAEAVEIHYNPDIISYPELLDVFWRQINPTTPDRQFVDQGDMYRPGIFYLNEKQKKQAESSRKALAESGRFDEPIAVEITEAGTFWRAEEYHQDYYKKQPLRYKFYRFNSGRDQYLERVWGD